MRRENRGIRKAVNNKGVFKVRSAAVADIRAPTASLCRFFHHLLVGDNSTLGFPLFGKLEKSGNNVLSY